MRPPLFHFHIRTLMIVVTASALLLAVAARLPNPSTMRVHHFSIPVIIFVSMIVMSYLISIFVIISVNNTKS